MNIINLYTSDCNHAGKKVTAERSFRSISILLKIVAVGKCVQVKDKKKYQQYLIPVIYLCNDFDIYIYSDFLSRY